MCILCNAALDFIARKQESEKMGMPLNDTHTVMYVCGFVSALTTNGAIDIEEYKETCETLHACIIEAEKDDTSCSLQNLPSSRH
jgi:hypothetical protein